MTADAGANLAAVLEARAAGGGWAGDVAFLDGGRAVTHGQVHEGAARTASLLAASGVGRGDRVLIVLPDGMEFVWAFLGAVRLGAIAVPVNSRLTEADHRTLAADAGARLVVCGAEVAGRFGDRAVLPTDGLGEAQAAHPPCEPADVGADDPAYAQYTSGTTGAPKAAVHGHGDPLVYFDAFARPGLGLARDDVVLSVSKLYFAYGLGNSLFFPLLAGCRAVLHGAHPEVVEVVELMNRHRVTVLFAVPTFYARLVAAGVDAPLRAAVSAGEALLPALAERVRAVLGCPVLDGIGSTEVGQTFASNTLDDWRDGTVGRPLPPYRVEVRDEGGMPVAANQVGGLWVAGPTLPLGDFGEPPPSARPAWLPTGDRAELDADGYLRLHGRTDDIELVGGNTVAPLEIERVLSRHPAVAEVAVAAVVGEDGASRLEAFVVPNPGAGAVGVIAAELQAAARAELAPFKVPRSVTFVDSLPRTPTGKLRRYVLRAGRWGQPASEPNASR